MRTVSSFLAPSVIPFFPVSAANLDTMSPPPPQPCGDVFNHPDRRESTMNDRCIRARARGAVPLLLGLLASAGTLAQAQAPGGRSYLEPRVAAGKCVSPAGTLLA